MVGDGLNARLRLRLRMSRFRPISAAHLSQATAILVFLGKPLAPVVAAIDYSRKALHLMPAKSLAAVGYNFLAVQSQSQGS